MSKFFAMEIEVDGFSISEDDFIELAAQSNVVARISQPYIAGVSFPVFTISGTKKQVRNFLMSEYDNDEEHVDWLMLTDEEQAQQNEEYMHENA